ncbi:SIS domain-containing protein [Halomontanus rarus]|uniref:SIS domain-containing protein n=1 Tax=Halomontanus rarus TaxID=3034020 RepID=UPI0023E7616E|nr:SIS domain-containing protein [Halovivax sp. TS33]
MPTEHVTIDEIESQPAALEAVLESLGAVESELAETLSADSTFCLVGCGTSYYLAQSGSAVLNEVASSVAIPGSEALISPDQLPDEVDVVVPVSRSGESTETVRATEALTERYPDATVCGVTCTEGSAIENLADVPIVSPEGSEESVVMTKSFSSMLVAFEYVARVIETGGASTVADDFRSLPADSEQVVSSAGDVARELGEGGFEKSFFLGSGEHVGLASEAMLKLEEMTLSWTKAYHALEFRHGPQSIADENTLVTVFLPDRRLELYADLLDDIADLGATSLVVGTSESLEEVAADYTVEIPEREFGSLPLYAPPFQLLGYYKAVANDLNPDEPQNLTQVVTL